MNNKSNAKLYITIGIILILLVGFIVYKNVAKVQNYKENGKEVECVVTSVTQGRKAICLNDLLYKSDIGKMKLIIIPENIVQVIFQE